MQIIAPAGLFKKPAARSYLKDPHPARGERHVYMSSALHSLFISCIQPAV